MADRRAEAGDSARNPQEPLVGGRGRRSLASGVGLLCRGRLSSRWDDEAERSVLPTDILALVGTAGAAAPIHLADVDGPVLINRIHDRHMAGAVGPALPGAEHHHRPGYRHGAGFKAALLGV